MNLNPEQEAVVEHIWGPALVLAPAGSGKTMLLSLRAARASALGIPAKDMLCITFTNLAARQLRARIEQTAPDAARNIWIGTFHAFCASVLRIEAKHLDIPGDFVIYDEEDCKELLASIIKRQQAYQYAKPVDFLNIFDLAKSNIDDANLPISGYDARNIPDDKLRRLHQIYSSELISRHALDFSDLIYFVRALLANNPKVREKWAKRFQFIQVDEAQDTHLAEYDVIRTLAHAKNIALLGDLDQSIYCWRGADPIEVKEQFERDFHPKTFTLPVNYRATKKLIHAADSFASATFAQRFTRLIPDASCPNGRRVKSHFAVSEDLEALWIGAQIKAEMSRLNIECKDIAVLCRTNRKAMEVGEILEIMQVPCLTVEQYQFFRRQEIKDVIAFLKLLLNPYDLAAAHRITLRHIKDAGEFTLQNIVKPGARVGLRLPDFLSANTFIHDDPHGPLLRAYEAGRLLVLDTETTGLNPVSDNIVELAYCVLQAGQIKKEVTNLLRSNKSVASSVHVHGITDNDLQNNGIDPKQALLALLEDSVAGLLVGHNISFDLAIMQSQAARLNIPLPEQNCADTYELARRFLDTGSYRLTDLRDSLNLPKDQKAHRAMGDVKTTIALLHYLMPLIAASEPERRALVASYRDVFYPFAEKLAAFRTEAERQRPPVLLESLLEEFNIRSLYSNDPKRLGNLEDLVTIFKDYDRRELCPADSLRMLVQFSSLAKHVDHLSEGMNRVIVSTIHQSKGLEFQVVFIAGAVDGLMPIFNTSDMEEEKRLFYVAMTRPKQQLYVTGYQEYESQYGTYFKKNMTPFLSCLDDDLLEG